ncbi:hypothetical protein RUM44_013355 [Polyplax serrata]|uniref:Bromodomain protein 4 C-terminal domain-containing protein n=1 Tax=Polyplax serrata TaxID=468196 RepID=A0ABR1BDZ6_POLSC
MENCFKVWFVLFSGRGGRPPRKKNKKHSKPNSGEAPNQPANAPSSVPLLNNLLNKAPESQSNLSTAASDGAAKPGIVASHSLPPQPSRPISTATAAPIKKPLPVKPAESVADALPTTTPLNTLSKPGVPSVTPIQIRAPAQQPAKVSTQALTQVQPQIPVTTPQQQPQSLPQSQPQVTEKQQQQQQQPDLTDPVGILPQTLDDLESHLDMSVTASPSSLPLSSNSMTNPPLVPMLNDNDMFQHSVVLKTPSVFPPPVTLPVPISHSNGYPATEIKVESPTNVVAGVPSVFDPVPGIKEEKPVVVPQHTAVTEEVKPSPANPSSNFASAFKTKPPNMADNLKNASSWSSLAQASSPHNALGGTASNMKNAMDSFQAFKKQAKEKADRQRALIEQQEIRRLQKEQAEKERIRIENERRREREEEEALEKARKAVAEQQQLNRVEEVKAAAQEDSSSPNHGGADKSAAERERQRLREQERRRREALAGQIDMNMQSDLMAAFEESL